MVVVWVQDTGLVVLCSHRIDSGGIRCIFLPKCLEFEAEHVWSDTRRVMVERAQRMVMCPRYTPQGQPTCGVSWVHTTRTVYVVCPGYTPQEQPTEYVLGTHLRDNLRGVSWVHTTV